MSYISQLIILFGCFHVRNACYRQFVLYQWIRLFHCHYTDGERRRMKRVRFSVATNLEQGQFCHLITNDYGKLLFFLTYICVFGHVILG